MKPNKRNLLLLWFAFKLMIHKIRISKLCNHMIIANNSERADNCGKEKIVK